MITDTERGFIKEAFEGHSVILNSESKSWLVKNPKKQGYWLRVTWCPGSLSVSGDVGEIVLTHYHAMPTWQEAVEWVKGSCHVYLMQKSNKKREFNEEETVKQILLIADEYLNDFDDDSFWVKLAKTTTIDITNKDEIREEIKLGYFESPQTVYEFMDHGDWTGSYLYDIETHYLYAALQLWANSAIKGIIG